MLSSSEFIDRWMEVSKMTRVEFTYLKCKPEKGLENKRSADVQGNFSHWAALIAPRSIPVSRRLHLYNPLRFIHLS